MWKRLGGGGVKDEKGKMRGEVKTRRSGSGELTAS